MHVIKPLVELAVYGELVMMVQEDQAMPVRQPGVRVHQPAGILRLLRLATAHPGVIRRGEGRRRKPPHWSLATADL